MFVVKYDTNVLHTQIHIDTQACRFTCKSPYTHLKTCTYIHNWPDLWMEAGNMAVNAIIFDYSKAQNYKSRDFCL